MKFEYIKFWLRWYWLPYKENTVLDMSVRWLCFELRLKRQPTKRSLDGANPPGKMCEHGRYGACVECGTDKPPRK